MPQAKKSKERIIRDRLRKLMESSRAGKNIELATYLVVNKGDLVPSEFRGLPQLKVNAKGLAEAYYSDGWCQSHWDKLGDWSDSWGECWDNSGEADLPSGLYETQVNVRRFSLEDFSLAERVTLSRFGLMR